MAIKSQTTLLRVSTASAAADVISAATAANPVVLTATAHGIADGAIATVASVAGMVELNDRAYVVDNPAANTVELKGIDGAAYTAYTSGGTLTEHTMTEVAQIRSLAGFDGQSAEIDTTHLRSRAKEYLIGLQDFGQVTLSLFLISDAGQARLRSLKSSASIGVFSITLSDGSIAAFRALVKQFSFEEVTPDGAVSGQVVLRVTGEPSWFA